MKTVSAQICSANEACSVTVCSNAPLPRAGGLLDQPCGDLACSSPHRTTRPSLHAGTEIRRTAPPHSSTIAVSDGRMLRVAHASTSRITAPPRIRLRVIGCGDHADARIPVPSVDIHRPIGPGVISPCIRRAVHHIPVYAPPPLLPRSLLNPRAFPFSTHSCYDTRSASSRTGA